MPAIKNEFDIGPLSWVKPEIELALRRAEEGIKRLSASPNEQELARATLAHLHQVSGALLMVGLEPIARISGAAEKLVEVISHGDLLLTPEIAKTIHDAITTLSRYLESLMRGEPHRPLILYPHYKNILNAHGKEASEVDLFYPDLSRRPKFSAKESPRLEPEQLQALISLKRSQYQRSLLNIMRDRNIQKSLSTMRNALATVEATQNPDTRTLWWIAVGFIEGLLQHDSPLDNATKQLCARLDLQIKRQSEGSDTISERLIRELLFAIAHMEPKAAKIGEIQETYGLKKLLPSLESSRPDDTCVENALHGLSEEIDQLKETWLNFASGNQAALNQFIQELEKVRTLSKQFRPVSLDKAFSKVEDIAENLGSNGKVAGESLSLEMATALLMLKDAIENFATLGSEFDELVETVTSRLEAAANGKPLPADDASKLAEISRVAQEKILLSQLGQEILNNLNHIEQALDVFFRDPQKRQDLEDLPALMNQVLGALSMLESKDAVSLLQATRDIVHNFIRNPGPANLQEAELTAEAFSNLGLFISALQQGRENPQELLHPVLMRFNLTPIQPITKKDETSEINVSETIIEIDVEGQKRKIANLFEKWQNESLNASLKKDLSEKLEGFKQEALLAGNNELADKYEKVQDALSDALAQPASIRDLIIEIVGQNLLSAPETLLTPSVSTLPVGVVTETSAAEIDAELLEVFLEEASEVLDGIAIHQDVIAANPTDKEAFAVIRRGFHTLKGSGRMVGLNELGEVAWQIEQVMNKWLRDEKPVIPPLLRLIKDAHHSFTGWIAILKEGGNPRIEAEAIFKLADQLKNDEIPEGVLSSVGEDSPIVSHAAVDDDKAIEVSIAIEEQPEIVGQEPVVEEQQPKVMIGDVTLDREFFEIFSTEAKVHVATLQQQLLPLRSDPSKNVSHDFMRAAHTLTGISRTCGFLPIAELGFNFEKWLLDRLEHPMALNDVDLSLITASTDALSDMVRDVLNHVPPTSNAELVQQLEQHLHDSRTHRWEQEAKGLNVEEGQVAELSHDDQHDLVGEEPIAETIDHIVPVVAEDTTEELSSLEVPEEAISFDREAIAKEEMKSTSEDEVVDGIVEEYSLSQIDATEQEELSSELASLVDEGELSSAEVVIEMDVIAKATESIEDVAEPPSEYPQISTVAEPSAEEPIHPIPIINEPQKVVPISIASTATLVRSPFASESVVQNISETSSAHVESGKERRVIVDDIDEQLLPIFLEEAFDLLPDVNDSLRNWRNAPDDKTPANLLARHLHTLKGSARMAGIMRLGELVHIMESNAMSMQSQSNPVPSAFDNLEESFDRFALALEKLKVGESIDGVLLQEPIASQSVERQADEVDDLRSTQVKLPATALAAKAIVSTQGEEDRRAVLRVRADLVDRFVNDAGEISIARSRIEGEMNSFRQGLTELGDNVTKLRAQLREIEIQAESQIQSSIQSQQDVGDSFDPLEFDRFTRMQELTRFMAESVNDFVTLQQSLRKNLDEADAALAAQSRLNRDMQQDLMSVRMVPLGNLADRFYRVVRQTAKELGKKANLEFKGMRTELDRSVLEQIVAPFEHLLRNAISHGIESPQVREAAGKPPIGEITIDARQEANEIVLTFTDDGAGINAQKIREKAIDKGLLSPDQHLDDKQLIEYIFMPGFSTADEVTQIAGRGVGMDVVKSAILTLGGRFETETVLGQGTKFIITLPLTLAVTQVLLVRANGTLFAIPSAMIELVQQRKLAEIEPIREKREITWQNNHYTYGLLSHLLGEGDRSSEPQRYFPLLLLRSGIHRAAIEIDSIEGNREIVVKSIGPQLARLTGITGATVLGNGQVVLILNPVMLAGRYEGISVPHTETKKVEAVKAPLIMVVDDSLTVRKITSRLLLREGYQVITAKDGVDALQQLQEFIPDVMLLDIEMPRMDGFELMRNVRADEKTAKIPIIMITSRTAEKHRNYAFELGVNEYLGKPFQEDDLLANISRFTGAKVAT